MPKRIIIERKFIIYVAEETWQAADDDVLNSLSNQADAVLSFAERYIEDNIRGIKPMVFVTSED